MKKRRLATLLLALVLVLYTGCSAQNESTAPQAPAAHSEGAATAEAVEKAADIAYDIPIDMATGDDAGYRAMPEYNYNAESYLAINENAAQSVAQQDAITFSLKVDTAAYSNVERYIRNGSLPPADAVRMEELINYFVYEQDISPVGNNPFGVYAEVGQSPFDADKYLALVRVKSKEIDKKDLPASNLTFLIDSSGSMDSYDKLPLLKEAFALLVETLDQDDRVSIVTYAGNSAVVLDSATGAEKARILASINALDAGGSTAGEAGLQSAYALAEKNFIPNGNNRIILATDGDFNVGIATVDGLLNYVSEKRGAGVYLSVLGFGTGNLRDDIMETLAANGNGNYSYIHSVGTAQKVLIDEMGSNLFTVADDVKAQIVFDTDTVVSYRLIGYENRRMENEDFENDFKDAGEIGAGTDVLMLLELELTATELRNSAPLFVVSIRYKEPGASASTLMEHPVTYASYRAENSSDFSFAASVAGFGHLLRGSEHTGDFTLDTATTLAKNNLGQDAGGLRLEYLLLLREYQNLL